MKQASRVGLTLLVAAAVWLVAALFFWLLRLLHFDAVNVTAIAVVATIYLVVNDNHLRWLWVIPCIAEPIIAFVYLAAAMWLIPLWGIWIVSLPPALVALGLVLLLDLFKRRKWVEIPNHH